MIERRAGKFIESLSKYLVVMSGIGAIFVLVDPVVTFALANGATIKIGGNGFADQMKGAVVMLILIGGFTAVISYWLGASNQGDKAQDSVMAQAAAPAGSPIKTDELKVDATGASISIDKSPPDPPKGTP